MRLNAKKVAKCCRTDAAALGVLSAVNSYEAASRHR
jgi:hypothetical protein